MLIMFSLGKIYFLLFYFFTLLLCYFVTLYFVTFYYPFYFKANRAQPHQLAAPSKRGDRAQPKQREDTGRSPIKERTKGAAPAKRRHRAQPQQREEIGRSPIKGRSGAARSSSK